MATTLETLSATDQAEFSQRLATYGLVTSAVLQSDLVVPANSTMTLSANDVKSFVQPHVLTTTNLDVLKSWIGVPDTLFTSGKLDRARVVKPKAAVPATIASAAAATAVQRADLRTAATAYLYGDSALVTAYKAEIEKYFGSFQIIIWPFYTITVNAGAVLTIGPGQNVLSAWKIVIDQGGTIKAPYGGLKTSATILQKA